MINPIVRVNLRYWIKIKVFNIKIEVEKRNLDYKLKVTRNQFYLKQSIGEFSDATTLVFRVSMDAFKSKLTRNTSFPKICSFQYQFESRSQIF